MDSIRGVVVAVLFGLGTAAVLLSCIAVLRLRGLPTQLHGLAPAGTLGAPLLCLGVAIDEGVGRSAGKALLVAFILLVTGPVAATATARSALSSDEPPVGFSPSGSAASGPPGERGTPT